MRKTEKNPAYPHGNGLKWSSHSLHSACTNTQMDQPPPTVCQNQNKLHLDNDFIQRSKPVLLQLSPDLRQIAGIFDLKNFTIAKNLGVAVSRTTNKKKTSHIQELLLDSKNRFHETPSPITKNKYRMSLSRVSWMIQLLNGAPKNSSTGLV